jgi:hypothetical protein
MSSDWNFRQREDEPEKCAEEGCVRPACDGVRCKLHADISAYRDHATMGEERSADQKPLGRRGRRKPDRGIAAGRKRGRE